MIKFKNVNDEQFFAVGTIERKHTLNGEKSLSGTLFEGDDVLNHIDKGWSLEFDSEQYIVSYYERNDNNNTVIFDAIHKFFWDMAKSVLYSETSGSHTIKWYLDSIFSNTSYTYNLNFSPSAISKENWGMKTKLSLFNDIVSSIEGEFRINGNLVTIFKQVGTDLSTIVRYGFNLSDMTLENNISSFVTYGEGFGAYADQDNRTGDRVHVTYSSPLEKTYGRLEAEPIVDERYTQKENLLEVVKEKVDNSFSLSLKLSLYDLRIAGYPYKMATVGDWLLAIDENLNFKKKVRIISIDDSFAADGQRISYTVTAGNISAAEQYQDSTASLAAKVDSYIDTLKNTSEAVVQAIATANGKNTTYFVKGIENLPTTANEGDLAWVETGDGVALYIWTRREDGTYYWKKILDDNTAAEITDAVNKTVDQAKASAAALIQENNDKILKVIEEVASETAELTIERNKFDEKAQGYADKALADAKSNIEEVAKTLSEESKNALEVAKTGLIDGINQEIANREMMIAEVNSKAQGYADQAKADALEALKTADGIIRKSLTETEDSLTSSINQNKLDIDGKIIANSSSIKQALDEISTKVSKTEYDQATGDLSLQLNQTTQTATQSTHDIVDIRNTAELQSAKMNSLVSTAEETKSTISDLQTVQGVQSGSISQLIQRADGYEATVTKVGSLDNAVSKAQLTADKATLDLKTYSKDNDERISKAESSIIVTAKSIEQKVSQDDYNVKTGELSTQFSQLKQTATSLSLDVADYKQDTDGKIAAHDSKILLLSDQIGLSVASSVYNQDKNDYDVKISNLKLTDESITQTVLLNSEKIATQQIKMDSIIQIVSDPDIGLNKRVQTAEGTLSEVTDNVSGITSKQTQMANQIVSEINNRENGDSNILLQAKDFTTSTITSTESSLKSMILQKADAVIVGVMHEGFKQMITETQWLTYGDLKDLNTIKYAANVFLTNGTLNSPISGNQYLQVDAPDSQHITQKVWSDKNASLYYTRNYDGYVWSDWVQQANTETLLSIFNDSWSIGTNAIQADGITKKIITGINGTPDGTLVVSGKSIVLDSDTIITGGFTVKRANIANAAIGTAQIGDAAITSAKIAYLDVYKLSGDVSNFIQSNWNGTYGSTVITSAGMTVSSGEATTTFDSNGMLLVMSKGEMSIGSGTKSSGSIAGVTIDMRKGANFTSFGFNGNDEMIITKTGSDAAGLYNIGGGVAFNHNVSLMDNVYMKYGKGFYGKWGDPQQAIFFQTINGGIPAIMHISGAGIAFGHSGDLYLLSHGGYQDFNNPNIKGNYTVDQPWITG
ncbi:phage tail protein [Leuconostoc mesenteroides]|uniref:phage tail protein n=1 Tax=Leuconostoc mesenteroides TaxID=1245 RepID=UPI00207878A3|nr:phage tail protein [Leuconostoc mesenteroides]USI45374.1 phage tail protein [Leuconostoc mesenteroides]